jgi:hypothetical protein
MAAIMACACDGHAQVLLPFVVLDCGINLVRENVDFYKNIVPILVCVLRGLLLSGSRAGRQPCCVG